MRRLAASFVLMLAALFCLTPLSEVDFFWHLAAGRLILETGVAPRVDPFTYTSAGRPWIDLHWLFQAAAAWIEAHGGFAALDLAKPVLVTGAFGAALWAAGRRRRSAAAPLLALAGVVASQERFTLRPEMVSFVCLGIVLVILARRGRSPRGLYVLPPLFALWANVHALYVAGLAAMALVVAGDLLERRLRSANAAAWEDAPPAAGPGLASLGASALATLLTPYGFSAWALPRTLLLERIATANLFGRTIAEFQAPFSGFGVTAAIVAFALLTALVGLGAAIGWRALRPADALLLAGFLGLALLARRNLPLFALVAIPSATPSLALAGERLAALLPGRRGAGWAAPRGAAAVAALVVVAALGLGVDVASNRFYARDGTQRLFGRGVAPAFYPEGAATFVADRRLPDAVLNDMTMGGYLEWRWFPARRTYIDGRLEVPDPALYAVYRDLQQSPERFEGEAAARGIRTVVWSHRHAQDAAPLLQHLMRSPTWRLVYVDLAAAVFVRAEAGDPDPPPRVDPGDPGTVARLLAEAAEAAGAARRQDPLPGWLRRSVPRLEVPESEVGAALFLAIVDRPAASEALFQDAAGRAPWSALLQYDLGVARTRTGRGAEARAAFEAALRLDPSLAAARQGLAMLRLQSGDEEGALQEWSEAERRGPLPPAARHARGAIRARRGRVDEAIQDYRAALQEEPGRADWHAELALLYAGSGLSEAAHEALGRALALDPGGCLPRVAESRLRRAQGDLAGAETAARAASRSAPDCLEGALDLARLLAASGRSAEAAEALHDAIRRGADARAIAGDPILAPLAGGP